MSQAQMLQQQTEQEYPFLFFAEEQKPFQEALDFYLELYKNCIEFPEYETGTDIPFFEEVKDKIDNEAFDLLVERAMTVGDVLDGYGFLHKTLNAALEISDEAFAEACDEAWIMFGEGGGTGPDTHFGKAIRLDLEWIFEHFQICHFENEGEALFFEPPKNLSGPDVKLRHVPVVEVW